MNERIKYNPESSSVRLREYFKKGFLFHGSPDGNIEELEPRQATDSDPTATFNIDTAVFAAKDPADAVIFAVMPPKNVDGMESGTWSVPFARGNGPPQAEIPSQWKPLIENRHGYVYVLPPDTFEGTGGQRKSKQRIIPADAVKVEFQDFERLGGRITWIDSGK